MEHYKEALQEAQLALVRWQQRAIEEGQKTVIIFEGRDAAGKDGVIRRLTRHLSVRHTRTIELPKPGKKERSQWYFQRYVSCLPSAGETTIFNRSWYNRAGVERVMNFCTPEETEQFLRDVPAFEWMLAESGLTIIKFWLDVSRSEQRRRLEDREDKPLKALKSSKMDTAAQDHWDDYTRARDEMLHRTATEHASWIIVPSDEKKTARIAVLRYLAHRLGSRSATEGLSQPSPSELYLFNPLDPTSTKLES